MSRLPASDVADDPRVRRPGLILFCGLALLFAACRHGPDALADSRPAYKGSLRRLSHVGPRPLPDLENKVVLVSFFATWCFPCMVELPALEAIQRQYSERGFTIVSVGMDLEGARVLRPFADHYQLPYPVLVSNREMREGDSPYGLIRALPSSVLLGRDGEVRAAWSGIAKPELISEAIERALKDG